MALINCNFCGKQISDKAKVCPHCGNQINIEKEPTTIICEECGSEIPSDSETCPNCGFPIKKTIEITPITSLTELNNSSDIVPNDEPTPSATTKQKSKPSKKLIIIFIAIAVVITGAVVFYCYCLSPDAQKVKSYNNAVHLLDDGKYEEAMEIFESFGDYENSYLYIDMCRYYLGLDAKNNKHDFETAVSYFTNNDYKDSSKILTDCSFLCDLEKSVTRRLEMTSKESYALIELCTTELAQIEKYQNKTFSDSTLKNQCSAYISGINKQIDAQDETTTIAQEVEWYEGMIQRYDVLNYLYNKYQFMANNTDFVSSYIKEYDYQKDYLTAYKAIRDDINAQINNNNYFSADASSFSYTFRNNTSYTFDMNFEYSLANDNGVRLDTLYDYIPNIGSGQTYISTNYMGYTFDVWIDLEDIYPSNIVVNH